MEWSSVKKEVQSIAIYIEYVVDGNYAFIFCIFYGSDNLFKTFTQNPVGLCCNVFGDRLEDFRKRISIEIDIFGMGLDFLCCIQICSWINGIGLW